MSEIHKKKLGLGWLLLIIFMVSVDFALLLRYFLQGKNVSLFNPKGLIAQEQYELMTFTVTVLLIFAIPILSFLFFVAWKYRETNTKAKRSSISTSKKPLAFGIWLIPSVLIFILASAMLPATERLDPRKSIASDVKPLKIQVVSMRWKWLFLYPEQQIATVNYIQIPINTPVEFELTADESPMSSFWVPNLGGQLYAMTGHVNRLNLIADNQGDYAGSSAEINGAGFSGMKFTVRASYGENFEQWVQEVKGSQKVLDTYTYDSLLRPSENNPVALYSNFNRDIFAKAVAKYTEAEEGTGHH